MKLVKLFSCLLIGSIFLLPVNGYAQKLRIESQDGQKYVIHKVQAKETVYSISKQYEVEQSEIIRLNPTVASVIKVGEEIRIPYSPDVNIPKLTSGSEEEQKIHTVEKGEWLSQIARKYEVPLDKLKEWNGLKDETILPGQELIVGVASSKDTKKTTPGTNPNKTTLAKTTNPPSPNKSGKDSKITLKEGVYKDIIHEVKKGESLASLKRDYGVSMADIREWNNLKEDAQLQIGQKILIRQEPDETSTDTQTTTVANNTQPNTTNPKSFGNTTGTNNTTLTTPNNNTGDPFGSLNSDNTTTNTGANPFDNLGNTTNTTTNTPNNLQTQGQVKNTGNYTTPITHTVKEGETIHQISSNYNVARSEIRYWNNMPDDHLQINQPLNIYLPYKTIYQVKPGETTESIAQKFTVQTKQINIWNKLNTPNGILKVIPGQNLELYLPTGPRPNGLPSPPNVGQYTATNPNANNNQFGTSNTNTTTWSNNSNNTFGNTQNTNTGNFGNTNYPSYTQGSQMGTAQPLYHTVRNNETIMDVAKLYNIDQPIKIADWNNLGNNYALTPGQRLVIYNNNPNGLNQGGNANLNNNGNSTTTNSPYINPYSNTPYNQANPFDQNGYPGIQPNNNTNTSNPFGNQTDPGYNNTTNLYRGSGNTSDYTPVTSSTSYGMGSNIQETGFAEVIKNIQNPKPFVALHRTAPVGTLVQVKNQANGKTVIVTVVGPLTNSDNNTIIQLTDASYVRLAAIQNKFPVEISYLLAPRK